MQTDREDKLQLLALLTDIHRHLASGKTIRPDDRSVLNRGVDAESRKLAPTLTEYIGGVLQEMQR